MNSHLHGVPAQNQAPHRLFADGVLCRILELPEVVQRERCPLKEKHPSVTPRPMLGSMTASLQKQATRPNVIVLRQGFEHPRMAEGFLIVCFWTMAWGGPYGGHHCPMVDILATFTTSDIDVLIFMRTSGLEVGLPFLSRCYRFFLFIFYYSFFVFLLFLTPNKNKNTPPLTPPARFSKLRMYEYGVGPPPLPPIFCRKCGLHPHPPTPQVPIFGLATNKISTETSAASRPSRGHLGREDPAQPPTGAGVRQ